MTFQHRSDCGLNNQPAASEPGNEGLQTICTCHGYTDIVFDGAPSMPAPRFVEVEDENMNGKSLGEWVLRPDGMWVLRIPKTEPEAQLERVVEALREMQAPNHPGCLRLNCAECTRNYAVDYALKAIDTSKYPDYKHQAQGYAKESHEIEVILAEALGYTYDAEYGWAVGDHTAVTLAMEAANKLTEDR